MQLALTGDVMLGRLVDEYVIRNHTMQPAAMWGDLLPLMLAADRRLMNLECVISSAGREWHPDTKAFHFRAHPRAIEFLRTARIDCVTLANNHVMDFGPEALLDCLRLLDQAGIKRAGAGPNLAAALEPAYLDIPEGRFAVVALTDNEPDWAATAQTPGTHYVAYDHGGLKEPHRSRVRDLMKQARSQASLVIVSAHVGPNWGAPSRAMRALAHEVIDLGADLYWGHSNHTPQGIEVYNGRAILHSTGDFVDDYAVDEKARNDLSFLFVAEGARGRLTHVRLYPVRIEDFRVRLANEDEAALLQDTMQAKCAAFGTSVEFKDRVGQIAVE